MAAGGCGSVRAVFICHSPSALTSAAPAAIRGRVELPLDRRMGPLSRHIAQGVPFLPCFLVPWLCFPSRCVTFCRGAYEARFINLE